MFFFLWAFPWFIEPDQYTAPNQPYTTDNGQGGEERNQDHFWVDPLYGLIFAEDSAAQWFMAAFAAFATVASVYAVWLLRETLKYTKSTLRQAGSTTRAAWQTVRETKRIGEAQVRAYVSALGAEFATDHDLFWCKVILKNAGQSPAFDVKMTGDISFMRERKGEDGRREFFRVDSKPSEGRAGTIEAGSEGELYMLWSHTDMEHFGELSGRRSFTIAGHVSWIDVFDEEWKKAVFLDDTAKGPADFFKPGEAVRSGNLRARNRQNVSRENGQ
jgi:hypothetical protein